MDVGQGTPVAGAPEATAARRKVRASRQATSSRPTPGGVAQQAAAHPTHRSSSPAAPMRPLDQAEEADIAAGQTRPQVGQACQLPGQHASPRGAEARDACASRADQAASPLAHAAPSLTAPMQQLDQAEEANLAAGHTAQQVDQACQLPGQAVAPEGAREGVAEADAHPREATAMQGPSTDACRPTPAGPSGRAASPSPSQPEQPAPAQPEAPSDGHAGLLSVHPLPMPCLWIRLRLFKTLCINCAGFCCSSTAEIYIKDIFHDSVVWM